MKRYAHSLVDAPEERWESLSDHLQDVGELAGGFAATWGAATAGRTMGLLHDIGKCSDAYQRYIRQGRGANGARGPDHSTAGAREALRLYGPFGSVLAFGIAGHHGGLMDGGDLARRQDKPLEDYAGWEAHVPGLPDLSALAASMPRLRDNPACKSFNVQFFQRMLFSSLVDADFLATERFYAGARGEEEPERGGQLLEGHLASVRTYMARHRRSDTAVNGLRSEVLDHAVAKAALPPGLFTLTVPTGGGKTLTSLSFALEHAAVHDLRRVVYVIPFTSIIEQTAEVFRAALGEGLKASVLEHHSAFDWDKEAPPADGDAEGEGREGLAKLRRDAENWDAPVVVTTAVQFFESLFAARPSRCRKLHNLAKSVIVIDEAQAMPVHLLRPCMAALDELARNYGASVVLCTATQPALRRQDCALPKGVEPLDIPDDRELAPGPQELYQRLRRVAVEWRREPVPDAEIAARFAAAPQMLCIVNSRAHARALFEAIGQEEGATHITTLMCAAHRRDVLAGVRGRLHRGEPVRLVATSLIEAGVDVSFPEVWRAATGLASIAQAAGRCNRNGELEGLGRTVVFEPAEHKVPPTIEQFYAPAREVLRQAGDDVLGLEAIADYYRALYWRQGADALDRARLNGDPYPILYHVAAGMNGPNLNFPFASISSAFRLIDEVMEPVLIPFDAAAREALHALEHADRPPGGSLRRLQQYTVPVPARFRAAMLASGAARRVREDYGDRFVLLADEGLYTGGVGLSLELPGWRESEDNIV